MASSRAKGIIVTLIVAVLAVDALALLGSAWIVARSSCTFADMASMVRDYWPGARGAFALRVKLLATESGLDLFSTPQGQVWAVHGEETLGFLEWEQWRDIYEPSGHEVRPGDIVLDCGANVGTFTKKALSRGAALVVAIEPAPQTLNALRRNLEADAQAGRVIVYPKGVWDRDAELEMTVNQVNQGANSLILGPRGPVWSKVRVPLTTIDSIVAELRLPHVDFIKMDIEGAEKQALTGARETIRRFHPRMSISSEHLRDDPTAIPALVNSIEPGYRYQGCDCVPEGWGLRPEVLAFDPGV